MVQLVDMFSQREYKSAHLNKEIIGKLSIIDQGWDNAIKSVFAQYVDSVSTLQTQTETLETKTLYMDNRCFLYIYTGGIFFLKINLYIFVDDGWYKAGCPPHKIEQGWPSSALEPSEGAFELTHGSACTIGW